MTKAAELAKIVDASGNVVTSGTVEPAGDTAAGDNAAIGFTSAEGIVITGQGSTNDVTIKNDADADVIEIPTGTTNVTVAGTLTATGFIIGSADINENDLESIDGITAGTIAASKAAIVDTNKDITGFRNITLTGELDAATLDVSGDADIDGTLEADAITVNGTALSTVIAGTTVTTATNANHVSVADNESTNEENLIPFIEDTSATGNVGLESDGDFAYNPSTGTVSATVFKGNIDAVDGDFDGTLEADAITIGGTAIASVLSPVAGSSSIVTTGALNSGSITSGFGSIDTGSSTITTTGVGTFGSLDISGDIDVDGTTNLDNTDIDGTLNVQGETTLQTNLNMGDSDEIKLGAGVDLKVFSDGTNGVLRADNGRVYIQTDTGVNLTKTGNAETMLIATPDGAVELYHDNSKKIETTSSGFKTVGAGSVSINLGSTNAGGVQIVLDGDSDGDFTGSDYSYIRHETDGRIDFVQDSPSGTNEIRFYTEVVERFRLKNSEAVFNEVGNDVDFRVESDVNSYCFFIEGSTGNIGINTSAPNPNSFGAGAGMLTVASAATGSHKPALITIMGDGNDTSGTRVSSLFYNDASATGAGATLAGVEAYRASDHATDPGANLVFSVNASGGNYTERFRIASNGDLTATDTSIGSNSDSRLKKDITDYTYDLTKFKSYDVKKFNWKHPELHMNKTNQIGFLAQDLQNVDTQWVSETNIVATDQEGNAHVEAEYLDEDLKVLTSKLGEKDAMYISVIQQLITRIEALEGA
jgi:cytoskeletal protein CcmA (bactofilin family)